MTGQKIIHVVGTGTIGESLIGILTTFKERSGIAEEGSEYGFGKMYARRINDGALERGKDKFIQVVSCNTSGRALRPRTAIRCSAASARRSGLCIRRPTNRS
jgi:hypothetical protein